MFHQYAHISSWSFLSQGHSSPSCPELLSSCWYFSLTEPKKHPRILFTFLLGSGGAALFLGLCSFSFRVDPHPYHLTKHSLCELHRLGGPLLYPSVQFSRSVVTLCNPMNRSTLGLPVHHHLLEFTQTHVHRVGDAIQPSWSKLNPAALTATFYSLPRPC